MLLSLLLAPLYAADWPSVQGTEAPDAPAIRPFGFTQVVGEAIVGAQPVEGLKSETLAPFNGELASFNRVGSGDSTFGFSVRRARLGLRGAAPGTDGRVSYVVAAELGDNQITRLDSALLTDAAVTFSYIPGVKVRAGQFKLPLGEEALEMNPLAAQFVNTSAATLGLLAENPIRDGAYTGGASGYRDLGVEAFDAFALGKGELSYALMLSNGHPGALDADDAKDLSARVGWAPRVWGEVRDPLREELMVYAWAQAGTRQVDDAPVERLRAGVGGRYHRGDWTARAELIAAQGALELGANPPFPGEPIVVSAEGRALGGYAYGHFQRGHYGAGLRVDSLVRDPGEPADLRVLSTLTVDGQLVLTPKARLLVDYEVRRLDAPHGSADALLLADTMANRVLAQVSLVF